LNLDLYDNMVNAMSISERIKVLKKKGGNLLDHSNYEQNISKWRTRNSLVSDESFKDMLEICRLSLEDFALGIQDINEETQKLLIDDLRQQTWFLNIADMINNQNFSLMDDNQVDSSHIFQINLLYIKNELLSYAKTLNKVSLTEECLSSILTTFYMECLDLGHRLVIVDLHEYKINHTLVGNEKEQFIQYLKERFSDKNNLIKFLTSYPVFTRILFERTEYFLTNTKDMINNLEKSASNIVSVFNTSLPLCLTNYKGDSGDSHSKGKKVCILTINNEVDIVYKPKNLEVAREIREFQKYISHFDDQINFYIPKAIYAKNFTLEEKVKPFGVKNESEVKKFYQNFGQLIALAYILRGNDLHYENIIASGVHPVVIDLETFFQHPIPIKRPNIAKSYAYESLASSVDFSGLLPFTLDSSQLKNVEMSALIGGRQKLPSKVLKVSDFETANMKLTYEEHFIEEKENLPKLNEEKIDVRRYKNEIFQGFQTFLEIVLNNKNDILNYIQSNFNFLSVRIVVKATQKYAEFLKYSLHPSCLKDMIEREKVLENLWEYPYKNKELIMFEIKDLMHGDIPIFTSNISKKNMASSDCQDIEAYYTASGLQTVLETINNLDINIINKQLSLIKLKFNEYDDYSKKNSDDIHILKHIKNEYTVSDAQVKEKYISKAIQIGDYLLSQAIFSLDNESVTWNDCISLDDSSWIYNPLTNNIYDGLSGMYIYFHTLYHVTKLERFEKILNPIMVSLEKQLESISPKSAYVGNSSLLYPLLLRYINGETSTLNFAKEIVESIDIDNINTEKDWINGKYSLIKIIYHWYTETDDDVFGNFINKQLAKLSLEKSCPTSGFGHGYTGELFLKASLREFYSPEELNFSKYMEEILAKCEKIFSDEKVLNKNLKVCRGILGEIFLWNKEFYQDNEVKIKGLVRNIIRFPCIEDSLCHGKSGMIDIVRHVYTLSSKDNELQSILIELTNTLLKPLEEFSIRGIDQIPSKGLFTGLSGIGYVLLAVTNPTEVPSLWKLDPPKIFC